MPLVQCLCSKNGRFLQKWSLIRTCLAGSFRVSPNQHMLRGEVVSISFLMSKDRQGAHFIFLGLHSEHAMHGGMTKPHGYSRWTPD